MLVGNVNPLLIHSGTPEEVRAATTRVIEKLGRFGGLIIQDGSNIPPGSPIENINAMMAAAESRVAQDDWAPQAGEDARLPHHAPQLVGEAARLRHPGESQEPAQAAVLGEPQVQHLGSAAGGE